MAHDGVMGMEQVDLRTRYVADVLSGSDEAVVTAAKCLITLGEYGSHAGEYPLAGGKAALRLGRLADAVVLLHQGLRVAEPNSLVWADLLVNRAVACAHHGFYPDAITAANKFLDVLPALPATAVGWVPYAHHALGLAHDRLQQYGKAVPHHRLALESYADPVRRAQAAADLAYSLTLSGNADDADVVLAQVPDVEDPFTRFVLRGTLAIVRYCQRRFADAVVEAERAEAISVGHEDLWASPLAEVRYWLSRAVWELGDRCRAAALALHAAVVADQRWNLALRDAASDWLTLILEKGGLRDA